MAKKNYQESQVVADLNKKQDIRVVGNEVNILKEPNCKGDVGIKSKGKIDFLLYTLGYRINFVSDFKR